VFVGVVAWGVYKASKALIADNQLIGYS